MSCNHPKSKDELRKEYVAMKRMNPPSYCSACGCIADVMEPHHPAGRHGTNILRFIWLDPFCHRLVHHAPKPAHDVGLLWGGRNTREITDQEWEDLKALMPFPPPRPSKIKPFHEEDSH